MDVEVDQSIKIEPTSKDTILAFSNDGQVAILIPAKVKRQMLAHLKVRGKPAPVARLMLFGYHSKLWGNSLRLLESRLQPEDLQQTQTCGLGDQWISGGNPHRHGHRLGLSREL